MTDTIHWQQSQVLVTGGTGSFGRKFVEIVLREKKPKRLVILSRDELKQSEMRKEFPDGPGSPVRYFIGDVRDRDRLYRAFRNIDLVVHAAALKQVPACEYNPIEAVMTNVIGAKNVIDAALDLGVKRVIALSTDKAVNPVNLYGGTKLVAEKLFVHGNSYAGDRETRFSCVRYGNVLGSRGSVIPIFLKQRETGRLTLTDPAMTRFWLTLEQGVRFVLKCADLAEGGEIFVPKVPASSIQELAELIGDGCQIEVTGIRPGEKVHEVLISEDEARNAVETDDLYAILPHFSWWQGTQLGHARALPAGFRYTSNSRWVDRLSRGEMAKLVATVAAESGLPWKERKATSAAPN